MAKLGHLQLGAACLAVGLACALPARALALGHSPSIAGSPAAAFTFDAQSPESGQLVSFDGSSSSDTGATIVTYAWRFGDGGRASGARPTHTYSTPGTYAASLTVTDSTGLRSLVTHQVTVSQGPAAAFVVAPIQPLDRTPITFHATSSTPGAAGGQIAGYGWSFGDGSSATASTAIHTYGAPGTYTVKLTVVDAAGAQKTASQSVATLASYRWSFGDGTSASGAVATHSYTRAGTYTVTLAVTDALGLTDTTTEEVTVAHAVPAASITVRSAQPVRGQQIHFIGAASHAPDEPSATR